ncbi:MULTISPECIES: GumC family protein [unclassified Rhizobium]|uniref:GumC family protein n=1 Tax=unclassified Rhizobium TaxID=2613769 RepID=UPI0007158080|nr:MULTISPECIES: GNVR domain-containing protein [unclassified Rhizobium]KQT05141.1 hypothetical protein ASG42_21720 [Rhizobium sp. Leaf391]KQU02127.1 hypothetical protein ASG68_28225 [Rhizobium sp. Leaf453]
MIHSEPLLATGEHSLPLVLSLIIERRAFVGSCIAAGILLGLAGYVVSPPKYTAEAVLALDVRKLQALPSESVVSALPQESPVLRTEIDIIGSRMMAERVLLLLQDMSWSDNVGERSMAAILSPLPKETRRPEGDLDAKTKLSYAGIVNDMMSHVRAVNDGRSYTIYISFVSGSPQYAAAVANAYGQAYIAYQIDLQTTATRRVSEWLGSRLINLRAALEEAERAATSFREDAGLMKANGITLQTQQIAALNGELASLRARLAGSVARLATATEAIAGHSSLSLTEVLASPTIQQLRVEEARIDRALSEIRESGASRNPALTALESQLLSIKKQISLETNQIIGSLRNEIDVSRKQQSALEASLRTMQKSMSETSRAIVHADQLDREASANRAIYESYLTRYKQTIEQDGIATAEARIISRAMPSDKPSSPNLTLWLLIGFIAGLATGLGLALLQSLLDKSVGSLDALEKKVGLPVLGTVPDLGAPGGMRSGGIDVGKHDFNNALADLQARLRLNKNRSTAHSIAITSRARYDGKSFLIAHLGRSFAASGRKTIIVDANLRTPTIGDEFCTGLAPCLSTVVRDGLPLDEAIRHERTSGVDVICSRASNFPAEFVLGNTQFSVLLDTLKSRYDVVLIDTPALSEGADAVSIAVLADATVIVVRMDRADIPDLATATKMLLLAGRNIIGIVVNDRSSRGGLCYRISRNLAAVGKAGATRLSLKPMMFKKEA